MSLSKWSMLHQINTILVYKKCVLPKKFNRNYLIYFQSWYAVTFIKVTFWTSLCCIPVYLNKGRQCIISTNKARIKQQERVPLLMFPSLFFFLASTLHKSNISQRFYSACSIPLTVCSECLLGFLLLCFSEISYSISLLHTCRPSKSML